MYKRQTFTGIRSSRRTSRLPRTRQRRRRYRTATLELLEDRRMLSDWSGRISEDTSWNGTSEPYRIVGQLVVDAGKTLTVGSGVTVTQAYNADVTVNGSLVLSGNAQWDTGSQSADVTVNGQLAMQAGSRLQVDRGGALTINAGGVMTATDAQWLKLWAYDTYSGIVVKGSLTLTNSPVSDSGNYVSYIDVHSGKSLTAVGSNLQVDRVEVKSGGDIRASSAGFSIGVLNLLSGSRGYIEYSQIKNLAINSESQVSVHLHQTVLLLIRVKFGMWRLCATV